MKKYKFKAKIIAGMGGGAAVHFSLRCGEGVRHKGQRARASDARRGSYTRLADEVRRMSASHAWRAQRRFVSRSAKGRVTRSMWWCGRTRTNGPSTIPAAFKALMKKEGLLAGFEKLSYTHRKEYCRWIDEAKKEETRQHRMEKAIEMLKKGVKTPG